jgi:serine/threonine protein kinase
VKVLRNDKDCFDGGLGEVRVLALIARNDPDGKQPLVRLLDYLYYKEHLVIVTELLGESLFSFCRQLNSSGKRVEYFSSTETLSALSSQMLSALKFLHSIGCAHCDLKTDNVCIESASGRRFKIIDLGSAVLKHDCHNSYVQSRWYRAPEVMLGLPWDAKVDVWSLGCVLAEVLLGAPLFRAATIEGVLACHHAVLGRLPQHMLSASPSLAKMFFTHTGQIYQVDPQQTPRGVYLLQPKESCSLDSMLHGIVSDQGFLAFLHRLLTMDPQYRPPAAEVERDAWLESHRGPSTTQVPRGGGDVDHMERVNSFSTSLLCENGSHNASTSTSFNSGHQGSFSDSGSTRASPRMNKSVSYPARLEESAIHSSRSGHNWFTRFRGSV